MKQRIVKLNKKIDDHGLQRVLNIYELSAIDCAASVESGYKRTVVTLTADEPEPLHFFDRWSITGAELTGDQFTFVDSDVTAQANYINYYPITYESDDHTTITGDDSFIPGSTGITLQTGYDTYYRVSGYEVTGGTIEDGVLIPTGPCTAKIYSKPNTFTATGTWEKGTNFTARTTAAGGSAMPTKYAVYGASTGDVPASWHSTSNRWKPLDVSNYKIQLNMNTQWSAYVHEPRSVYASAHIFTKAGDTVLDTTVLNMQNIPSSNYYPSSSVNTVVTSDQYNVNYKLDANLWAGWNNYWENYGEMAYLATGNNSTWSATGYAP